MATPRAGRRVGERQPSVGEVRCPVPAEDGRGRGQDEPGVAYGRRLAATVTAARAGRLLRPRVRRPHLAHQRVRRHAHQHRPARDVDPVIRGDREARVDPPQERQWPDVEIRDPVPGAQAPARHRPDAASVRGAPAQWSRGQPSRPTPIRRQLPCSPPTARTTSRPCRAAARRGGVPGHRLGRSRPSRPTTSRRSGRRTGRGAEASAGSTTTGSCPAPCRTARGRARPAPAAPSP